MVNFPYFPIIFVMLPFIVLCFMVLFAGKPAN